MYRVNTDVSDVSETGGILFKQVVGPGWCAAIVSELRGVTSDGNGLASIILPPGTLMSHTRRTITHQLETFWWASGDWVDDTGYEETVWRCIEILRILDNDSKDERAGPQGLAIFVGGGVEYVFSKTHAAFDTPLCQFDTRFHTDAV